MKAGNPWERLEIINRIFKANDTSRKKKQYAEMTLMWVYGPREGLRRFRKGAAIADSNPLRISPCR
jgi:hypothetical protein